MSELIEKNTNINKTRLARNVFLALPLFSLILLCLLVIFPSKVHAQQTGEAASEAKYAQQVADVQVITSQTTLNEQQSGKVYLQITNTSDFLLQIAKIDTTKTVSFIQMMPEGFEQGTSLTPQQAIIIPFTAITKGAVQPGHQLLVFDVTFAWNVAGKSHTSNIIVTKDVTVEILGVSQILSLLGVPTFLILPGVLMLITVRLILSLNSKGSVPSRSVLNASNSEFWVIAITLSILFFFAYIGITQWYTGSPRNYIVQYDLSDVITVWFLSIFVVAIPALIIKGFYSLYVRFARPGPDDSPVSTLHKLSYRGLSAWRQYCTICEVIDGTKINKDVVLLEHSLKGSHDTLWVCPYIVVKKIDISDVKLLQLQKDYDKMTTTLEEQKHKPASLQARRTTRRFVKLLAEGDLIAWKVKWSEEALQGHTGPFPIKRGDILSCLSERTLMFGVE